MAPELPLVVGIGIGVFGFLGVLGLSVPSIRVLAHHKKDRTGPIRLEDPPVRSRYVDEDGEATEESVAEFEEKTKWQAWSVVLLSILGLGVGSVFVVAGGLVGWVLVAAWVSIAKYQIKIHADE